MDVTLTGADVGSDGQILVLHVDDDRQVVDLASEYIEQLDDRITVLTETDPEAARERLAEEAIDCVVSDYSMPPMNGVDLLRAVREEFPNLPFILFTGKGSEDVASEAIRAGVTAYVQKGGPEVYEQLANRIEQAVSHRRSERRAAVAQDRLLDLYEQTDGFYILDAEWRISYWNHQMVERVGLESDDVLDRNFWDVFSESTETEVYDFFQRAMSAGEPQEFETYFEPGGYWTEIRAYPVTDGLFVHSRNISADKEREKELTRRNHILESFANTVSHDLRNPLNVAEGKLQLAQETGDFEYLEEVAMAHNRMRNLIDELLRIARGEALEVSDLSLAAVARTAWDVVSSEAVALEIEEDVEIEGHETQLQRLLENLFWNAIDHGGATTIRVGPLTSGFYVEDDGVGIPPTEREAVFESGYSTDPDSPGYGLSIVKGIVETHGWEITVTEGTAGGARFAVTGITGS